MTSTGDTNRRSDRHAIQDGGRGESLETPHHTKRKKSGVEMFWMTSAS